MVAKRKPKAASKRTPQLWDEVTWEGHEGGTYAITAMAPDGLTCTLTLMKGRMFTNLEHYRVSIASLTCVEK